MILYFSGTGNSKFVAEYIAKKTGDKILSLNNLIKKNIKMPLCIEDNYIMFVLPTYAWRIPKIIENFIRDNDFQGNKNLYFILTCGSETSNAFYYIKKLCNSKDLNLKGFAEIIMPENYIAMFSSPDENTIVDTINSSYKIMDEIINHIKNNEYFSIFKPKSILGKLESGPINPLFYKFFVNDKGFYSTDKCIGCGKCKKLCPLNNIEIKNKKPIWKGNCTHCMACISYCPTEAIEYKNKTKNQSRYYIEKYI